MTIEDRVEALEQQTRELLGLSYQILAQLERLPAGSGPEQNHRAFKERLAVRRAAREGGAL